MARGRGAVAASGYPLCLASVAGTRSAGRRIAPGSDRLRTGEATRLFIDDFLVCNRTFKDSSYETHALFVYTYCCSDNNVSCRLLSVPGRPGSGRVSPHPVWVQLPSVAQTLHSTYTWTPLSPNNTIVT